LGHYRGLTLATTQIPLFFSCKCFAIVPLEETGLKKSFHTYYFYFYFSSFLTPASRSNRFVLVIIPFAQIFKLVHILVMRKRVGVMITHVDLCLVGTLGYL
jgi:hypothetical protein